jgi:hypothetical protein
VQEGVRSGHGGRLGLDSGKVVEVVEEGGRGSGWVVGRRRGLAEATPWRGGRSNEDKERKGGWLSGSKDWRYDDGEREMDITERPKNTRTKNCKQANGVSQRRHAQHHPSSHSTPSKCPLPLAALACITWSIIIAKHSDHLIETDSSVPAVHTTHRPKAKSRLLPQQTASRQVKTRLCCSKRTPRASDAAPSTLPNPCLAEADGRRMHVGRRMTLILGLCRLLLAACSPCLLSESSTLPV